MSTAARTTLRLGAWRSRPRSSFQRETQCRAAHRPFRPVHTHLGQYQFTPAISALLDTGGTSPAPSSRRSFSPRPSPRTPHLEKEPAPPRQTGRLPSTRQSDRLPGDGSFTERSTRSGPSYEPPKGILPLLPAACNGLRVRSSTESVQFGNSSRNRKPLRAVIGGWWDAQSRPDYPVRQPYQA